MTDKAILILNGDVDCAGIACCGAYVVCADGAYDKCRRYFVPDLVIGDFDSTDFDKIDGNIQKIRFSPDKDYTDGHLAVTHLVKSGYKSIEIYGAFGGRPDHSLANYSLLKLASDLGAKAKLCGGRLVCFLSGVGKTVFGTRIGDIVSLVPFSDSVHILSTAGLKYPISDRTHTKSHIIGISNVAAATTAEVVIKSGELLVFIIS